MNNHPLVTLAVCLYNQECFAREAVQSVLSQDYDNLEVVISDDCSQDGTFSVVREAVKEYDGPHKIVLNRNNKNLGIVGHTNHIICNLSHGEYVMLLGGDDVCLPSTISFAMHEMQNGKYDSMAFNTYVIDGDSKMVGTVYPEVGLDSEQYTISDYCQGHFKTSGACRIVKREMYQEFGPLSLNCLTEDTTTILRTFLYGPVGFCYTPNLKYRWWGGNVSNLRSVMTRFDPELIYAQYRRDLEVAYAKGMITCEEHEMVNAAIEKYRREKTSDQAVFLENGVIRRLLLSLSYVFKRGYRIIDVYRLCRKSITWSKLEKQGKL